MRPRFKPMSLRYRRMVAIPAILAVLLAGVITTTHDQAGSPISALPGATAEPQPTGPTGGPSGDGGFNGGQFQPPGMPSPPGGYNGGNYPPPGQSDYGVDINAPTAQAPEYSQAPQYPQQTYPQRQQPVHGTQPPNYDAPLQQPQQNTPATQSAPEAQSSLPTTVSWTPQTTSPSPAEPEQAPDPSENARRPSSEDVTQSPERAEERCASAVGSGSATDGKVFARAAEGATEMQRAVLSEAVSNWRDAGAGIEMAADGQKPSVTVEFRDSSAGWLGVHRAARGEDAGSIQINLGRTGLSPDDLKTVVAHELGHALGLSHSSAGDSVMAPSRPAASQPGLSDRLALAQLNSDRTQCGSGSMNGADAEQYFTGEELKACFLNSIDCSRARPAESIANDESEKYFHDDEYENGDTKRDAARHCILMAAATELSNADFAKRIGDAHEAGNAGNSGAEAKAMDLHNNAIGRDIGVRHEGDMAGLISECVTRARVAVFVPSPSTADLSPYNDQLIYFKEKR